MICMKEKRPLLVTNDILLKVPIFNNALLCESEVKACVLNYCSLENMGFSCAALWFTWYICATINLDVHSTRGYFVRWYYSGTNLVR